VAFEPSVNYKYSSMKLKDDIVGLSLDKILKNEFYFSITLQIFLKNEPN
jgi:hypothetical protein